MDKIVFDNFNIRYDDGMESLREISFAIPANAITVLFGPAGGVNRPCCGRSTA